MNISLPGYSGEAALTREGAYGTLAYFGPPGVFVPGRSYVIESVNYMVISNSLSQYVPTITLVKLKEI